MSRLTRNTLLTQLGQFIGLPEADAISDWVMARVRVDADAVCDKVGVEVLFGAPALA